MGLFGKRKKKVKAVVRSATKPTPRAPARAPSRPPARTKQRLQVNPAAGVPMTTADWWQHPSLSPLWNQRVAGESYRQEEIARVMSALKGRRNVTAHLVPQPTNPHDPNAIAVCIGCHHVGYLPADRDRSWDHAVQEAAKRGRVLVRAVVTGGPPKYYGVTLWAEPVLHDPSHGFLVGRRSLVAKGFTEDDLKGVKSSTVFTASLTADGDRVAVSIPERGTGHLSAKVSAGYLPLLDAAAKRQFPVTTRAVVEAVVGKPPKVTVLLCKDPESYADVCT